ncbi:hypothetical protein GA0061098_10206 [Bradyrhizobium shewense]|uniref:Uncharacterized protein n=1 Tax=Bradyrhizobium shewense TaxID=1761772 RepID=A0A1C3XN65_9BRAD|nr:MULTISPECIES: hypothetical protein [Bradyrhizobium]PPQ17894.1 hypothetical protein CV770_18155 [Bradyrhizobium sp. AC87j1]SCB53605.1 hypothetical protein GA0061098_10206 [Bradyrhizobium shewense]
MTLLPELVPARIDWRLFAVMSTMPPRDPDDDEEDDDEEDEDEDEEENQSDESPVVREPDED